MQSIKNVKRCFTFLFGGRFQHQRACLIFLAHLHADKGLADTGPVVTILHLGPQARVDCPSEQQVLSNQKDQSHFLASEPLKRFR